MGTTIKIDALDGSGSFDVYHAAPTGQAIGAVVVIQEIFGVNPGIKAKVDSWAAAGYAAYAHDLFWRDTPGLSLDPDIPEQLQAAFGHMQKFDRDKGVADIEATIRKARADTGGKVGVTGYCLGGLLTFLSATRTDADAFSGYYGGGIDGFLNEVHAIANPLMLHFAGDDHFITPDKVDSIRAALADNSKAEIFVYPGVDHGFATTSGKRRNDAAAELADSRTAEFFAKTLA